MSKLSIAVSVGTAFYILKILRERGGEFMIGIAFCYAVCIVNGTRKFSDVKNPKLKALVKKQLEDMGAGDLAVEEE
uniref:hypothetical protein n=1 Tax=Anaerococcus mediterraneensis TaxID=1870984 RepID=UPI0013906D6D|nr:hypothetical protein [Anaerococcus mediterraneensis]